MDDDFKKFIKKAVIVTALVGGTYYLLSPFHACVRSGAEAWWCLANGGARF